MASAFRLTPLILLLHIAVTSAVASLPNIFFLLIDDLGWNDLSLHGGCDFPTPNLDALATNGLELSNYYVQHMCTPSRHALMSGRYPINDGMQEHVIDITMPYGMPMDLVTLPEMLKKAGYRTHMLGKWHLGFCRTDYTPTRRGFDSHLGFWSDGEDYYQKNKTSHSLVGLDFRDGLLRDGNDQYSTYIYGNATIELMKAHIVEESGDPFFIYFASQAVHTPWSAPQYLLDYFSTRVANEGRQQLAAVTTVLDDTVGLIVDYMKSEDSGYIWEDTLFIVSSDNGGDVTFGPSNFPLRGSKSTLWEGGVKATAWVTGGYLHDSRRGKSMGALMHISDWFPTLCELAGVDYLADGVQELDGYSQLENVLSGETNKYNPREILIHNIQPNGCDVDVCGAIRWRNYKIIVGKEADKTGAAKCQSTWCPMANYTMVDTMTIQCSDNGNYAYPDFEPKHNCPYTKNGGYPCLFDIESDPCEYTDLRESEPAIYTKMYNLLLKYNATQSLPTLYSMHPTDINGSNPALFNGFWSSWKDVGMDGDIGPDSELLVNAVKVETIQNNKEEAVIKLWSEQNQSTVL